MKQKFLCLIMIIALLCSFTPTLVYGMTTENPNSTMEDNKSPRACHESFKVLVDAMMKLKKMVFTQCPILKKYINFMKV